MINTLAMSLGFGVLMLSQVPANARLGILLVLGLVNCFVKMHITFDIKRRGSAIPISASIPESSNTGGLEGASGG